MPEIPEIPPHKIFSGIHPGFEFEHGVFKVSGGTVGEKKNYNLQPGVTEYQLWAASTIEWVVAQSKYKARALLEHKTSNNIVAINSWHEDFADAERTIDLVRNSLNGVGDRKVYNIWGETIEVHTSPRPDGSTVYVIEVLGLIWSMM